MEIGARWVALAAAAAVSAAWTEPVELGPVRGEIGMAGNERGETLIAWDTRDAIRWRLGRARGTIPTPAPGAPGVALNDRGAAAIGWGVAGEFGGPPGSLSLATRRPGRRGFRTAVRGIGDDEVYGPPAVALSPTGAVAWAWEGYLGTASLGIGTRPFA